MSLFDIFGDRAGALQPKAKNLNRLQLGNNENIGKVFSSGSHAAPVKPNEPLKKVDSKKSFLVNKGTALQSTPLKGFTPFRSGLNNLNKQPLKIYSDNQEPEKTKTFADFEIELEFHKPVYQYDNVTRDMFDYDPMFSYEVEPFSPEQRVLTPEPDVHIDKHIEFNYSYEDDFFNDDFSNDSIVVTDLELPSY